MCKETSFILDRRSSCATESRTFGRKEGKKDEKERYAVLLSYDHRAKEFGNDKVDKGARIHFVGHEERFDKWRPICKESSGEFPVEKFSRKVIKNPESSTCFQRSLTPSGRSGTFFGISKIL